jgi:hypothetical protein
MNRLNNILKPPIFAFAAPVLLHGVLLRLVLSRYQIIRPYEVHIFSNESFS